MLTRWCTRLKRRSGACIALLVVAAACNGTPAPANVESAAPRGVAAFTRPTLTIVSLEHPVAVPAAVGSVADESTLRSEDPAIVSINSAGQLVAHRSGTTSIQALGTSGRLQVIVRDVSELRISPSQADVPAGATASIAVLSQGSRVPPDLVHWSTTQPAVAYVDGALLRAGRPGAVELRATVGGAEATALALVGAPKLLPVGSRLRMRVGDVFRLVERYESSSSAVAIASSSRRLIVWASHPGEARLCAVNGRCIDVQVVP